ncbi:MAG: cyclic nucleotide-binding domain-containing protein [Pseudomonadota bacterium]
MEMTFESAFSTGGLVGHLSYVLLITSMLMRSMLWLLLFLIGYSLVSITYGAIWLKDPVSVFWESVLVVVNIIQITREWLREHRARFSDEETQLITARFEGLTKAEARHLLNMGVWVDGPPGTVLTTEGTRVDHVAYLSNGVVDILHNNAQVGTCRAGNFIGEMSVLGHTAASATAIVSEVARYWLIPSEKLLELQKKDPRIAGAFQAGVARDLSAKVISSNASLRNSAR